MHAYEITCISRRIDHAITKITHVGAAHWRMPLQYAIEVLESGSCTFYILRGAQREKVVISQDPNGHQSLRLESEVGRDLNSLLDLPEWDAEYRRDGQENNATDNLRGGCRPTIQMK